MTDKEKEAYNFFKKCNEKDLENFDYFSEPSKLQIKYIETILNLIQTQQEEKERLNSIVKIDDITSKCNVELIEELRAEIEKKDKIINEMAIALYDEWYMPSLNTVEKIKEYFLNEVEKESK